MAKDGTGGLRQVPTGGPRPQPRAVRRRIVRLPDCAGVAIKRQPACPGAAVTISVGDDGSAMLLRVANGPGQPADHAGNERRPGHGLSGMRERVALLGGSLTADPAPDGGFVVAAVLPLGKTA